ncbi:MAG TPA: hypothetical protein VMM78_19440 [Thermomicrobiales bacterium]|nr:hypothetical protein [Thermomicrobiales bacterium]
MRDRSMDLDCRLTAGPIVFITGGRLSPVRPPHGALRRVREQWMGDSELPHAA